ncbi:hypothetical protein HK100_010912 [Physocladia obscura]|uniref:Uncharacterized protein n=1 Tax=Physocladia obscura TaxID=109957 RepID=A0AAD5XIN2_9FUNG|nr:hypothetical protein HK100_010912 [Physocladia obscura]
METRTGRAPSAGFGRITGSSKAKSKGSISTPALNLLVESELQHLSPSPLAQSSNKSDSIPSSPNISQNENSARSSKTKQNSNNFGNNPQSRRIVYGVTRAQATYDATCEDKNSAHSAKNSNKGSARVSVTLSVENPTDDEGVFAGGIYCGPSGSEMDNEETNTFLKTNNSQYIIPSTSKNSSGYHSRSASRDNDLWMIGGYNLQNTLSTAINQTASPTTTTATIATNTITTTTTAISNNNNESFLSRASSLRSALSPSPRSHSKAASPSISRSTSSHSAFNLHINTHSTKNPTSLGSITNIHTPTTSTKFLNALPSSGRISLDNSSQQSPQPSLLQQQQSPNTRPRPKSTQPAGPRMPQKSASRPTSRYHNAHSNSMKQLFAKLSSSLAAIPHPVTTMRPLGASNNSLQNSGGVGAGSVSSAPSSPCYSSNQLTQALDSATAATIKELKETVVKMRSEYNEIVRSLQVEQDARMRVEADVQFLSQRVRMLELGKNSESSDQLKTITAIPVASVLK